MFVAGFLSPDYLTILRISNCLTICRNRSTKAFIYTLVRELESQIITYDSDPIEEVSTPRKL